MRKVFLLFFFLISIYTVQAQQVTNTTESAQKSRAIATLSVDNIKIYPNPAAEDLNVSLTVSTEIQVYVSFFNTLGKLINKSEHLVYAGANTITFSISQLHLEPGIYFLQIEMGYERVSRKIIVR